MSNIILSSLIMSNIISPFLILADILISSFKVEHQETDIANNSKSLLKSTEIVI